MSSASSSSPSSSDFLYLSSLEEVKSSLPCRSGYRTADVVLLDGCSLTPEELVDIGYEPRIQVDLTEDAWAVVVESRDIIDNILMRKEVVYGINTGFGNFANVIVREDELKELQCNLVRSHAAGVGKPLSLESTRMLLCLRINILAKGHSGIRPESLKTMLLCLRHNCLSFVPAKGTVGASGDLAPLSHLALGMMGEGLMWNPKTSKFEDAASVLKEHNIPPLDLHAKEGLALINGTQLISCIGAEAVVRARNIARQADCVGALTVEVLHGSATPFHPYIHKARPHRGQGLVAGRVRELLNWGKTRSEIADSHKNCSKVQDSYTLRCLPQIHGVVHETISFVYSILLTELNSATDNPMIFAKGTSADRYGLSKEKLEEIEIEEAIQKDRKEMLLRGQQPSKSRAGSVSGSSSFSSPSHSHSHSHEHAEKGGGLAHGTYYDVHDGIILSGGNFHGEYPAKALDFLAIGIHEISNVSERRIERLVNPQLSGLPAFLTPKGGLNSGFMIAHCTAAALVSENKTLCHPASVDSLSTSAAQEDHVSMGGFAARKALKVVRHVEYCVAIELLCACQGLEFLRPLKTTAPLEKVYDLIRTVANKWDKDRYMTPDIEAVCTLLQENKIWEACKDFIDAKHHEFIPRG